MTTSNLLLIRAALEQQLATVVPAIDTVFENTQFSPVLGMPYQAVFHLLAQPDAPTIDSAHRQQGYMQVSLFYPLAEGVGAALERATLIANAFRKGAELIQGTTKVTINNTTSIGTGSRIDDTWFVPVRVFWHSNFFF
jgi:hypothetical protein